MKSNICYEPFKNLNIEIKRNKVKVSSCCLMETHEVSELNYANDSELNNIRDSWRSETPPIQCRACSESEARFGTSRRIDRNQWFVDNGLDSEEINLVTLDFWVGDICNLRCAICGPHYSSAWQAELGIQNNSAINTAWKQLDLKDIRFVHFNGGEPLLSKEHAQMLQAIPCKSKVCINYNTNASVRPDKSLLDLWSKFKLVKIDFSIDDIGARFEYQRFPAKWDSVVNNINFFKDHCPTNCIFAVNTTLSILNEKNIHRLKEWIDVDFKSNRLGDPVGHQMQTVQGVLQTNSTQARQYLSELDSRRGTNWQVTFPELVVST